jgi:hypothetical protein
VARRGAGWGGLCLRPVPGSASPCPLPARRPHPGPPQVQRRPPRTCARPAPAAGGGSSAQRELETPGATAPQSGLPFIRAEKGVGALCTPKSHCKEVGWVTSYRGPGCGVGMESELSLAHGCWIEEAGGAQREGALSGKHPDRQS